MSPRKSKAAGSGQRREAEARVSLRRFLQARGAKPLDLAAVRELASIAVLFSDNLGRATPALAVELQRIERGCRFTSAARNLFQTILGMLGVDSSAALQVPAYNEPFWLRRRHPLKNYRSRSQLPESAEVVIIGAGLTGASAAHHLRAAAQQGRRIVVLDKGSPAGEASGRNAGHFELLPENSLGVYDGMARERLLFLRRCYPSVADEILRIEAERQASLVLGFALRNRERLKQIIEQEGIDCDLSPRGWLYLAHTDHEEQALCDEVLLAAQQGQRIELWSRAKIHSEFGFDRRHIGRFIPDDGTYHPAKYVYGVLQAAVRAGVELYTRVKVQEITSEGEDHHTVKTDAGAIAARRVIVATNAFTAQLFPELRRITPAQSQIAVTEFAPDLCRGRLVTSEEGPVYFNQPREGAGGGVAPLLLGGGQDRSMRNPASRRRSPRVHAQLLRLRDQYFPELKRRPFSTEWVGPIALTPDQLPAVGFLRPGVVIAAGFNGYGGSYCTAAGQAAATMTLTGEVPPWLPQDVFSPQRLLQPAPLFLSHGDSLWRIAGALCRQLRAVNQQISQAVISAQKTSPRPHISAAPSAALAGACSEPASSLDAGVLRALPAFRDFSLAECQELLALMRMWKLSRGTVLFAQGDAGDSCFITVSGAVDVTLRVRGEEQRLARLTAGSLFGQVALIEGGPRTATCALHQDSVLLEIQRSACDRLFAGRSTVACKLLAALNQGLIEALRGADRQLMRLTAQDRVAWDAFAAEHAPETALAHDHPHARTAAAQAKSTGL